MNFYTFKRGTVVMANFSPQVGSEIKGKHFAIVLTKKDRNNNELLTVIPLTSKYHKYHLDLVDEIKNSIWTGISVVQNNMHRDLSNKDIPPLELLEITTEASQMQMAVLRRYVGLKEHSYAKIHQITTISKLRIVKPVNVLDPIRRLKVSNEVLDKIDKKIVELFTTIDID